MIRENLSSYPANEQLAFNSFEARSTLTPKSEMAFGTMPKRMNRRAFTIVNKELINQHRWCEFLRTIEQLTVEFSDAEEIGRLFQRMGVDTRTGNTWEMYLERDDLFCDYRFQVNLEKDAPFFVKVLAYAKDNVRHRHHH